MKTFRLLPLLALAAACAASPQPNVGIANAEAEKAAIRQVVSEMEASWNRGDFRGYMEGFKNPDVVFVSRGEFQRDWQGTLDHYVRDYGGNPERRGKLRFFDLRIEILSPDGSPADRPLPARGRRAAPGRDQHPPL